MINKINNNIIEDITSNLCLLKLELRKIAKPNSDFTKIDSQLIYKYGFKYPSIYNDGTLHFKYDLISENTIMKKVTIEFSSFDDCGELEFKFFNIHYGDNSLISEN